MGDDAPSRIRFGLGADDPGLVELAELDWFTPDPELARAFGLLDDDAPPDDLFN